MARNNPEARSAAGSMAVGPTSGRMATGWPASIRAAMARSTTVKMMEFRSLRDGMAVAKKVAVCVVAGREVGAAFEVTVVLGCLHEGDGGIGEVPDRVAQVVGVDEVVGVDHPHDLGIGVAVALQCEVERTRLEAGPRVDVHEADVATAGAVLLDRAPDRFVLGVVVHDDDLEVRVVERLGRSDRLDEHVRGSL
jgi:hypothetical protein